MAKITKDTIGVGFIGAGDISILHARAVAKVPGAKLIGLWNRSQDRATQRQHRAHRRAAASAALGRGPAHNRRSCRCGLCCWQVCRGGRRARRVRRSRWLVAGPQLAAGGLSW